jgi:hypothetical protein
MEKYCPGSLHIFHPDGRLKLFYYGSFKKGKFHEKGVLEEDGTKFTGDFKEGMKEGHGKMIEKDLSEYEGGWSKDLKHGEGVLTKPSGEKVKQNWKNGIRMN